MQRESATAAPKMESIFKPYEEDIGKNDGRISEILEQESMEVDTPLHPSRVVDIMKVTDESANQSSSFLVPASFSKEQVNPVKAYNNMELSDLIEPDSKAKSKVNLKNGILLKEISDHLDPKLLLNKQLEGNKRGIKQRKNSQLTTKSGGENLMKQRRNSKMSSNIVVKQSHGTQEKRNMRNNSSRENTTSSMSIDFDKMDKQRDDYSDFSKMVS